MAYSPEISGHQGLSDAQVLQSRQQHGSNRLSLQEHRVFTEVVKEVVLEPMFLLLLAACTVYFVLKQYQEGIIMGIAIFIVAGISLFQEYRSRNAIEALRKLSAPRATVFRNGAWQTLATDEIVVGDLLLLEEGEVIAADGLLVQANDFSANESLLTGEAFPVHKSADGHSLVYKGTLVTSGSAAVQVNAVGEKTMFGKIGLSLQEIRQVKTPLQTQIRAFVRNMVWLGAVALVVVVVYQYQRSGEWTTALLQGLTLAMSVLPEEIPVAFSTFQALGAFRLLRQNIIVKQPQYVETLGAATVICADKTGTLTQNRMQVARVYDAATGADLPVEKDNALPLPLLEYAMWASETTPFDPMEKAIHALYAQHAAPDKRPLFSQIHEYPIGGKPPMMTHVFRDAGGHTLIAAKGGPEAIMRLSGLSPDQFNTIEAQARQYARQGWRVLGVGAGEWPEGEDFPVSQEEFSFRFLGLVAFHDPPKANMAHTIKAFHHAGIQVKMITGDYAETATTIARQVGLPHTTAVLTGDEVLALDKDPLMARVKDTHIFARMFPEAKLRVIDALKENGEVVAMTGDGVNDAPALKAAHIGIAMGKRGSEVARNAASLVLTDDDLGHMVTAVALGRKIYDNLQKAIRYIVSIHIPIILIVAMPLVLGWAYPTLFSPVHVIFLELIMGPTCSIIYENEPMEPGTMQRPPRPMTQTFLTARQLVLSIIQGLVITSACLGIGYYYMQQGFGETFVRTVVFVTLLWSNIFLTLVNRSFVHQVWATFRYPNTLIWWIIGATLLLLAATLHLSFLQSLFSVEDLPYSVQVYCATAALLGTGWLEIWKAVRRK